MNTIESTREAIRAQLAPLKQEHAESKSRTDELEQTIGCLEDALKALGGKSKARKSNHAKKEQVIPVLKSVVSDNPGIDKADAEELVKHKLKESGLGINGVSSQIRKYLATSPFQIDGNGAVSLASN